MKTRKANCLTTIIVLFFTIVCQAQKKPGYIPPSIDDNEEIPVVKTELPVPENGKDYVVQYFKGITDGVESRIAVKNLGYIIRPAMVQVFSEDGRELAIELVKKNWDDVVRSGKTKNGKFQNSFKTAIEFGIKISAKEKDIPFIVAVSAGIELFPASNLFVDASTMRSGDGNKEVTTMDEAEMKEQESGKSNNILYIIIAIVLVGILALLAVLLFKKKGKGIATILLLMIVFPLNAGITPAGAQVLGGLAENFIKSLGKHYGNGGFNGDDPLSPDDKDFEPEPDPRGQPSLPSSCYEIARISSSGFSGGPGGNVGKGGVSGANNTTNAVGGTNMTLSTGGMAGGIGGSETGAGVGHEDGKEKDYAKERQKIQDNFQHYRELALGRMEQGKRDAQENFNTSRREASKQFDKDIREANGNEELIAQASANRAMTMAQLSTELSSTNIQLDVDHALDLADLAEDLAYELTLLAEEEAAANQEQQNNNGAEKDPDREQGKGADGGDRSKGVGSPYEEDGSSNSGPSENDEERENRAGCKCLISAYADLQERRYSFEKLLKIGQHTKKVTDYGISFGDDFSGVHGVSGLVWQTQRAKVLKSIDKFDIVYNNKYKELLQKLYNVLIEIDECEKLLGYENWYSHSGFIYYEFMKTRYASYK